MPNARLLFPFTLMSVAAATPLVPGHFLIISTCRQASGDAYAHRDAARRYQQTVLGGVFTGALGSVYTYCHANALALLPSPDLSGLNTHTLTFTLAATETSGSWRAALELHDARGKVMALLQPISNAAQDSALTYVFNLPLTSKAVSADLLLNRGRGIERAHLK